MRSLIPTNKTILIDADSVLLRWRHGFRSYMKHKGHEWLNIETNYDMTQHFNASSEEVYEHLNLFNNGHWRIGTLSPVAGAVEGMARLANMGYRFVVISSFSTNAQAIALRQANLYNVFGDVFDNVYCIGVGKHKRDHLSKYESAFWIEDNYDNCVDGLKYGHKCILLAYPWNQHNVNSDIAVCDNWDDIVDYIGNNGL
jgi:FMN phosphatase YigB (HAD superfamily)